MGAEKESLVIIAGSIQKVRVLFVLADDLVILDLPHLGVEKTGGGKISHLGIGIF